MGWRHLVETFRGCRTGGIRWVLTQKLLFRLFLLVHFAWLTLLDFGWLCLLLLQLLLTLARVWSNLIVNFMPITFQRTLSVVCVQVSHWVSLRLVLNSIVSVIVAFEISFIFQRLVIYSLQLTCWLRSWIWHILLTFWVCFDVWRLWSGITDSTSTIRSSHFTSVYRKSFRSLDFFVNIYVILGSILIKRRSWRYIHLINFTTIGWQDFTWLGWLEYSVFMHFHSLLENSTILDLSRIRLDSCFSCSGLSNKISE